MIRSLYTAATGMNAQQLNMDVIANNLANVNTTGFKRSRANFQDLLYQNTRAAGTPSGAGSQVPTGIQVGMGTQASSVERLFQQGDFHATNNETDLVIQGDGFFQIKTADGQIAYTRDGSFKRNSQGLLVTSDGAVMQPEIAIPKEATGISIGPNGDVSVTMPGVKDPQSLGTITIARFGNAAGLSAMGHNLYMPTAASGDAVVGAPGTEGRGAIGQNAVEMSNVKVVEEMVDMITAQRAYEVNSKSIQASDEMLQIANGLRR